jgi:ankyrin repeat protein
LGNLVELKRLVEAGEDVDDISPWGETGIVIALLADRLDCAAYLFDRGCSIDIRNRQGETLRDTIGDHPYMQSLVAKRELIEMLEMELPVITTTKKRRM